MGVKEQNIKKAFYKSDLNQYELAELAGVSQATVCRFLRVGSCKPETMEKMRRALGIRGRNFYDNYTPKFERTPQEEMVVLSNAEKLREDIAKSDYTEDELSRIVRRSRRYIGTSIDGKKMPCKVLDTICSLIGHEREEYCDADQEAKDNEAFSDRLTKQQRRQQDVYDEVFDLCEKYTVLEVCDVAHEILANACVYIEQCGMNFMDIIEESMKDVPTIEEYAWQEKQA